MPSLEDCSAVTQLVCSLLTVPALHMSLPGASFFCCTWCWGFRNILELVVLVAQGE